LRFQKLLFIPILPLRIQSIYTKGENAVEKGLIVSNEIDSDIQIVANYLKVLKNDEIEKIDLYFERISPSDFLKNKSTKFAKCLPQNECEELVFDEIQQYISEPNYYEITSFINYLGKQFKYLNFYSGLSYNSLHNDNQPYRFKTFILKSIIKGAIYFIESSHLKFIKDQEMINEMIPVIKESNLGIENLIKNEEKEISSYNLNFPLLFFNDEVGNLFSIISNTKYKSKEYEDFYKFDNYNEHRNYNKLKHYNKFTNYKKIDLTNPNKLRQIDYLDILKSILNLKSPLKTDFIFMADYFVKMIYIIARLNANIPIVILEDIKMDKFSTIMKLIEMIDSGNNNTKILDIDSNTSEKDIIKFIEGQIIPISLNMILKENKEKIKGTLSLDKHKKIFAILKGINNCKSMGIISELICNNTLQGTLLPSNITFICICNSYVPKEERLMQIAKKMGLKEEEMEKLKSLEYKNLYPLPSSLLNFVINFGELSIQDKERYISKIIGH